MICSLDLTSCERGLMSSDGNGEGKNYQTMRGQSCGGGHPYFIYAAIIVAFSLISLGFVFGLLAFLNSNQPLDQLDMGT